MSAPGEKVYLGDGVYWLCDGYGFWLTTENGIETTNKIYLEPEVYAALERCVREVVARSKEVKS